MVRGKCETNLDDYQGCTWPKYYSENISIGHKVKEVNGNRTLRVVWITHTQLVDTPQYDWQSEPLLLIGLSK